MNFVLIVELKWMVIIMNKSFTVRGHWIACGTNLKIKDENFIFYSVYMCSQCGYETQIKTKNKDKFNLKRCPHCKIKMDNDFKRGDDNDM